jgi:hypothetical protein
VVAKVQDVEQTAEYRTSSSKTMQKANINVLALFICITIRVFGNKILLNNGFIVFGGVR